MRAQSVSSTILAKILNEIPDEVQLETESKMLLAARIDSAIKGKGWSTIDFAEHMGKQPAEIRQWLGGTQVFADGVLTEIEAVLGVELS